MSNSQCPQCGAPVGPNDTQCKYCGEKFVPATQPIQQQFSQQPAPQYNQPVYQQQHLDPGIDPSWPIKSKVVAGLLGIFLGWLGIHKFYMGKIGWGIVYLLFSWTYIPGIVGFIEGIIYLASNDHNFQVKHKVRIR